MHERNDMNDNPQARRTMQEYFAARFKKTIQIGPMLFGEEEPAPPPSAASAPFKGRPTITHQTRLEVVTLEQAQDRIPFRISLPGWIPDGFEREQEVRLSELHSPATAETRPISFYSVHLMWRHADGRRFGLDIERRLEAPGVHYGPLPVAPKGVSEVKIKGQPAALITRRTGYFAHSGETVVMDGYELLWRAGDLDYQLRAVRRSLTVAELIRIAESMP
jgi:hypothetical protein